MKLLLLFACTVAPPSVLSIDPAKGPPGTEITLTGQHFTDQTTVKLSGKPLEDLTFTDQAHLHGKVPAGPSPGPLDLIVSDADGRGGTLKGAFTLTAPASATPEKACDPAVRILSHIPPTADVVKIDRYPPGAKEPERTSIEVGQILAVVYELTEQAEGHNCAAIWLKTGPDQRQLFDSQVDADLQSQAQKIANGLGKRLELAG